MSIAKKVVDWHNGEKNEKARKKRTVNNDHLTYV